MLLHIGAWDFNDSPKSFPNEVPALRTRCSASLNTHTYLMKVHVNHGSHHLPYHTRVSSILYYEKIG